MCSSDLGKKLKEMGAQNVLVSMGKIGAALIDEAGQEYFIKSPEGKRVNTVGSGDSMVAGFIAGFLKYNNCLLYTSYSKNRKISWN